MVQQKFEMTSKQLEAITKLSKTSLHTYLDGWRFSHIERKRKKVKFKDSGVYRHIYFYTVTAEDIEALKEFKTMKLRHNGVL